VKIECAASGDTQSIVDVFRQTRAGALPYLPNLHTNEEDLAHFGSALCDSTVYVVKDRDRIVGFCAFRTDWVDHLYILPEYTRRGIGRALMDTAKAAHPQLQLWVFQRNEAAAAFYEAMGFTRQAHRRRG
jgi:putative acetyltransferase